MPRLIHELPGFVADARPGAEALVDKHERLDYAELDRRVARVAAGLARLGVQRGERVAVMLPKVNAAVVALLAASRAGAIFVPVNPVLKPRQVRHILRDCGVRLLVTTRARAEELAGDLADCHDLRWLVTLEDETPAPATDHRAPEWVAWTELAGTGDVPAPAPVIDQDPAAILYTSGSTGRPKGVVLTHANLVSGAESVIDYLGNEPGDRILCLLPLSFDYGLSQVTTAFRAGATAVLRDYLLPTDVRRALEDEAITGLAGVPTLWHQLAAQDWLGAFDGRLRYITNSGGTLAPALVRDLRARLPNTDLYLMYGLTEAFRSTYLPPAEVDRRPDSIGRPIPGAEVLVVNADGEPCADGEPGELVHRGCHVARGYWGDPARTAERFRPLPAALSRTPLPEVAVWSGDRVRRDAEGYLYFLGRDDDMIKASGYRVSPAEIEEPVYASGHVREAAAYGVPDPVNGEAIALAVQPATGEAEVEAALRAVCREQLPNYMQPREIRVLDSLPHTHHGKIDRHRLRAGHGGEGPAS